LYVTNLNITNASWITCEFVCCLAELSTRVYISGWQVYL